MKEYFKQVLFVTVLILSSCNSPAPPPPDPVCEHNAISLDVQVLMSSHCDWLTSNVHVDLQDGSYNSLADNVQAWTYTDGGGYAHYSIAFVDLEDGTYHLLAYYSGSAIGILPTTTAIYDANGTLLGNSLSFPNTTLGDPTGHSAAISMHAP